MNILLYGRLSDRVGRQVTIEVGDEGCTVTELRRLIANTHPELGEEIFRQRVRACVNEEIVPDNSRLSPHDTVEFLPPVSGG